MKIGSFVSSLLPVISKDSVIEDCQITRAEIQEATVPAYDAGVEVFKGWKFKSKELEPLIASFNRTIEGNRNQNLVETIRLGLNVLLENLTAAEKLVHQLYNEDIASSGFSYKKANILHFIEAAGFVSKYARKFLIYIFVCESHAAGAEESVTDSLTKAEIEWVRTNMASFCQAFIAVTEKTSVVVSHFQNIPDIVVNDENASILPSTMGEKKIDPFSMRFIPIWLNPIYHVRMAVAEWQAARYNQAKEELLLVQLRKLRLEKLKAGTDDAHLQKEIDYNERRAQGLAAKIAKMEKGHD